MARDISTTAPTICFKKGSQSEVQNGIAMADVHSKMYKRRSGFTLVEVLIVVVIIGILATIVVPQFSDASHEANAATLKSTLTSLRTLIDVGYHRATPPAYPATVDSSWFSAGPGLTHPENTFGVPAVEVDSTPNRTHPPDKVLDGSSAGAFWYNPTNGLIRARVAYVGSDAATLAYYNEVNDSSESDLGGGGGGGAS